MLTSLYPVRDMRLDGQVIHTGKSSMEIAVRMEAVGKDGTEKTVMLGTARPHIRPTIALNRSPQVDSAWSAEMHGHTRRLPSTH